MKSMSPGGRSSLSSMNRPTNFDFGNYPMTPWINEKDNPGQKTMKVADVKKKSFILAPKPREDMFIIT